jgi:hypothetical protein
MTYTFTMQGTKCQTAEVPMKKQTLTLALAATLAIAAGIPAASAFEQPRDHYIDGPSKHGKHHKGAPYRHDGYRYIRVESDNHPKAVIVPVRQTPLGRQVRLPGGSWVYCEITCDYTVRRQSLDFWENQGQSTVSPGYFRRSF